MGVLFSGKTERKCASALTRPSVGMACNKAADACKTDGDCSDAMMCCHDGCRKVCVSLEQGKEEKRLKIERITYRKVQQTEFTFV